MSEQPEKGARRRRVSIRVRDIGFSSGPVRGSDRGYFEATDGAGGVPCPRSLVQTALGPVPAGAVSRGEQRLRRADPVDPLRRLSVAAVRKGE
ncbi:hypothetical protein GCM10022215_31170 [Nocardioides fonticola]|uniref:Uncharacterized protein n=1 Tax=Nocardioides fonticola TaxID=450363 RepID=A0ABP7XRT6_9ACTN